MESVTFTKVSFKGFKVLLFTLLSVSSLSGFAAEPYNITLSLDCPRTKNDPGGGTILENNGGVIKGFGYEKFNGQVMPQPLFWAPTPDGNIPSDLAKGNYFRAGTTYSPSTGTVKCHYVSSYGFDPFAVGYTIVNGKGGTIWTSSTTYISLRFFLGLTGNTDIH